MVTSDNLNVLLDLDKYGVKESGVLFHVIQAPAHGRLEVSVWKTNDNIFTLLDLNTDKVSEAGCEFLVARVFPVR